MGNGEANLRWIAAHMSYPFNHLKVAGDTVRSDTGATIQANAEAFVASNRVAIFGPVNKILLVVMKSMNVTGTECVVDVTSAGTTLAVGGAHNSNIAVAGHGPEDISAVFYTWLTSANFTYDIPIWDTVFNRCKRYIGNEDDFREVKKISADMYARYWPLSRKFNAAASSFHNWYNDGGDPWTDNVGVGTCTEQELDELMLLGTTASGSRGVSIGNVRSGHGTVWTIKGVDPIIEIALFGKYIVYQNPIPKSLLGGATYSHSSFSAMFNVQIALFGDLLSERLHIKEGNILNPGDMVDTSNAYKDLDRYRREMDKALAKNSGLKLSALMLRNNRATCEYVDHAGDGDYVSLLRINKWWLGNVFGSVDWSNNLDYLDMVKLHYKVVDIGGTNHDQISESGISGQVKKEIQSNLRKIGLQGFMVHDHENWSQYKLASGEGQREQPYVVGFSYPTDMWGSQRLGTNLWTGSFIDCICDLPVANAPLARNSDAGNEILYLHLSGRRKLLVSYSSMQPMILDLGRKRVDLKYGAFDTSKRVREDLLDQIEL
jgi:hypothetical protein